MYNEGNVVYVLQCNDGIKVGRTTHLENRLKAHKASNPWIKLVKYYEIPPWGEKYIHTKLSEHLKHGCTEWFNYYDGIFEDIDRHAKHVLDEYIKEEQERQRRIEQKRLKQIEKNNRYKVFKFKDCYRDDYAFIVTFDAVRAFELLKSVTFLKCDLIEVRDISFLPKQIPNREYMYFCNIRNRDEYDYCKARYIDYNKEYGITRARLTGLYIEEGTRLPLPRHIPYKVQKDYKDNGRYSKKYMRMKHKKSK